LNVDVAAVGAGRPVVSAGAGALRQPPAAAASTKDKASAAARVRVNSRVGMDERRGRWEGDDNRLSGLPPSRLTLLHANRLFRVALLALSAGAALIAHAADPAPAVAATQGQAQAPQRIVVVHAGRLLDRPGKAPRGPSTIVIRDGRVSEVRDGFVDVPGSQQVIDQRARFVLPGLIDSHVHLVSDTGGQMGQLEDVQLDDPELAYNALVNAHKTLRAGFTTVRNLGDEHGVTLALRDAIRAGKVVGPNIVDAGRSISTTSGHMDSAIARNFATRSTPTRISATARSPAVAPCASRSAVAST
jgi:hypothetical protein